MFLVCLPEANQIFHETSDHVDETIASRPSRAAAQAGWAWSRWWCSAGLPKNRPNGCAPVSNTGKSHKIDAALLGKSSIIWQMLLCYGWLLDYLLEGHHNKSMKSCPDDTLESYQKKWSANFAPAPGGIWCGFHNRRSTEWKKWMPWPGPAWNTALVSASHLWMAAKASSGKAAASWMDWKQLEKMWEIRCQTIDYYDYLWIGGY